MTVQSCYMSVDSMLIEERVFKRLASPDAFRGGRELAQAKAIRGVVVERNQYQDFVIRGEVLSTTAQHPELIVAMNRQTVKSHKCSCSFDRQGMCKHVVALGLAAYDPSLPNPFEDRQAALKAALMRKSRFGAARGPVRQTIVSPTRGGAGIALSAKPVMTPQDRSTKYHDLDEIRFFLQYDVIEDVLSVRVEAVYGPFVVPILRPQDDLRSVDEKGITHLPARDTAAEQEAVTWLRDYIEAGIEPDGSVGMSGESIYTFIKHVYPELEFRYPIELDPSAKDVLHVLEESVEGAWSTRLQSGVNLFAFSVDFHCQNNHLSLKDVEAVVSGKKPFLRLPDGRFIEVKNREDLQDVVEVLRKAKGDGDQREIPLYEAPGFLALLERSRAQHLVKMDERFRDFASQVQHGKVVEAQVLPPKLDALLRSYQKDGVAWMRFLQRYGFGGILADDMGLGKTVQVLTVLEMQRETAQKPTLIVCPKSLMQMWALEGKKFTPDIRMAIVDGSAQERATIIRSIQEGSHDVFITSYSLLQRDLPVYHAANAAFSLIVLDEAHSIKNADTNTAKAVKLLPADHRLALTGTPLENGVQELWSIFDFLMPGFLGDADTFRRLYARPIQESQDQAALKKLRERVGPFMLRRTKESQLKDLPPKIEQVSPCSLTSDQLVLYTQVLESARRSVFEAVEAKGFERSKIDILAALTKLRRVCDHPALLNGELPRTEEYSGKMAYALELIREATEGGHKILVFSQFTSMLDILRESLDRQAIGHCTIEGKTRDRQAQVDRFHNDPDTSVFLLSLRAGGTGLTLTAADIVIMFDPWWNPMAEQQAMDRAHRMGQTKTVNVYKLVTQGTIEEKVMELQSKKRKLFDALVSENAEAMQGMSWEEVRQLFG